MVGDTRGFHHPPSQWSFPQRYRHTYTTELAEFVTLVAHGMSEPQELLLRHVALDAVTAAAELSWRLGRAVKVEDVPGLRHVLEEAHKPRPHAPPEPRPTHRAKL